MDFTRRKKILSKGGLLYLIFDFGIIKKLKINIFPLLIQLANAGVDMVQLRFKTLPDRDALAITKKITENLKRKHVLTVINDRCDIAYLADADGVHLGADDISSKEAKRILGGDKIIGRTVHSYSELKYFYKGADYISMGPVFVTSTKKNIKVMGIKKFRNLSHMCKKPVFAIGGITVDNIDTLISAGIKNVAVCQGILAHKNPAAAAKLIKKCLQNLS